VYVFTLYVNANMLIYSITFHVFNFLNEVVCATAVIGLGKQRSGQRSPVSVWSDCSRV